MIKGLVLFVYLMEVAQTVVMTKDCWTIYVVGFTDLFALAVQNNWLTIPIFTAIGECKLQDGIANYSI